MKTTKTELVPAGHPINENYRNDPLWQRLQVFTPDDPDASFPFTKKLAQENGWNTSFTLAAMEEYKRFAYLCCILPQGASPSPVVDQVWHLHLCYTINYWEVFCEKILQTKLHHYPSKGGDAEIQKHDNWMQDTLNEYKEIFGTDPPSEIWLETAPGIKQLSPKTASSGKWNKWLPGLAALLPCVLLMGCEAGSGYIFFALVIGMSIINGFAGKKKGKASGDSSSGGGCSSCNDSSSGCSSGDGGGDGGGGCGGCGGGD